MSRFWVSHRATCAAADNVRDDPWHHINLLCIRALTSARAFAAATCSAGPRAQQQVPQHFDGTRANGSLFAPLVVLIIFTWRWLANARSPAESLEKLRFSQFLLGESICWSQSITRGFELSAAHSVDPDDRFTFMKHLVEIKSQFPCGILFLRLTQKQPEVQIWGRCFSSIVGFRSPNFAQRNTLVYWNRINRHFEVWEKKYREMEFRPLGNESSPFCRTEWFQIHVKIAFFHLSVWLIGQGGLKFRSRPWFDSRQFKVQAEKCRWAGNCKFCNFFIFKNLKFSNKF